MEIRPLHGCIVIALLGLFIASFTIQHRPASHGLSSAFVPTVPEQERITRKDLKTRTEFERLVERLRVNPQRVAALPPEVIDSETLWLARGIFSETKRPHEMELVAWVIRNRVETGYRGKRSYKDVVLDPYQFSAFNPENEKRSFYSTLTPDARVRNWEKALTIAYLVKNADERYRPFPARTRHFYSEQSMVGAPHPDWALGVNPVLPDRKFRLDQRRFRFFADVS